MRVLANSGAFWAGLFVVLIVLYLLLNGMIRGVDALALMFLVNLIGTPDLIGWPAAMILAFGPRRVPPEPPQLARSEPRWWPEGIWMSDQQDTR